MMITHNLGYVKKEIVPRKGVCSGRNKKCVPFDTIFRHTKCAMLRNCQPICPQRISPPMRSACPQQIVSCRYVITFCVLCVFGILPQWAGAQPQSASQSAAAYVQPPKGASLIRLNHVVGQVVIERVPKNWFGAAQRLQIALFDTTHVLIATVLSDDEGQFEIEGIVPGAYTLAAGADSLHLLSIPLLVGPGPLDHAPVEHGLLLIMRANTDRRMSAASAITNQTLRAELLEMVNSNRLSIRQTAGSGLRSAIGSCAGKRRQAAGLWNAGKVLRRVEKPRADAPSH